MTEGQDAGVGRRISKGNEGQDENYLRRYGFLAVFALAAVSMVLPASAGTTYISGFGCTGDGYSLVNSGALRNGTYSSSSCPWVWVAAAGWFGGQWHYTPIIGNQWTAYYQWLPAVTQTFATHQICQTNGPCAGLDSYTEASLPPGGSA
jgi:hypothetical protein